VVRAEVIVAKRKEPKNPAMAEWLESNPLRRWRRSQPPEGWNQSVLARKLGVSPMAVANWETGKRKPMVDAVAKIEELTGITAKQWMTWHKAKPSEPRMKEAKN
jgi:ribosome-binding protein aMBF1 (putative translation factor)